ncbi:MAG TPA: alpha/beta fold hydrolase [Burkholderiales bacterium]|nr:alpha/beta fold hydrolase [Burkholderiales bacterium]
MRRAVLALLLAVAGCTSVFFQPHRIQVHTPEQLGLRSEVAHLRAADGVALYGWYLPARANAAGTVLFLHGNAENISTHIASVAWMPAQGFNVFLIDYRGYGASEGTASLAGAQLDIDAAMQWLLARKDIDAQRIAIFGQSLGGALAIYNVAHSPYREHVRALVTDSAFSDYRSIVSEKLAGFWLTWPFQWLPRLTVDDAYSPLAAVAAVSPIPLLVIHGGRDAIVPVEHARRLFDAARQPKELWIEPQAGHIQSLRDEALRARFIDYLRSAFAAAPDAARPPAR